MEMLKPTLQMTEFFIKRTNAHIASVNYFSKLLNPNFDGVFKNHDKSKFSEPEIIPYIFLTWQKNNPEYQIPIDTKSAIEHHYSVNPHHPQHYINKFSNVGLMPTLQLMEMVCDWAATGYEVKLINNRPDDLLDYYKNKALPKYDFTKPQQEQIIKHVKQIEKLFNPEDFMKIWTK